MEKKNGKIDIMSFFGDNKEPKKGIIISIHDENRETIVEVVMTYEQFGEAISGHGNRDMKYKKFG